MAIKERLENNIVFWTLAMLLAGFLAGIGTYKGILEIANLQVISKSKLVDLQKHSLYTVSVSQRKSLNRLVADRLEWSMKESEGKIRHRSDFSRDEYDELQYKRLRKAVFLNLLCFQADGVILEDSLKSLNRRGYTFVAKHITRVVADLPRIKSAKLRWLEDQAIPALRRDMERETLKQGFSALVVLPKVAWILDHTQESEPKELVYDMSLLQEEVSLLKEKM